MLREKQKFKVRMFFESMGWPKEAITEQLKRTVTHIKKSWKVTNEEYAEPEPLDDKMFVGHVEFEAEFHKIQELFLVTLSFGPSVVEILEPAEVVITANELQDVVADISSKVSVMDKDIKILAAKLNISQNALEKFQNKSGTLKEAENEEPEEKSKFTI
jgi:hypothetical protein